MLAPEAEGRRIETIEGLAQAGVLLDGSGFKLAAGGTPAEMKMWQTLLLNNQINAAVTGAFLVLVTLVVAANARVWWQILVGRKSHALREDPYVALTPTHS